MQWKVQTLRGQLVELGSAVRQLHQSGLDSATAQLLLSRKRAELEDLIKRDRADARAAEVARRPADVLNDAALYRG